MTSRGAGDSTIRSPILSPTTDTEHEGKMINLLLIIFFFLSKTFKSKAKLNKVVGNLDNKRWQDVDYNDHNEYET